MSHGLSSNSDGAKGQVLSRRLDFSHLFFITVTSMIGSGIFTTSGFILGSVQNNWLMLLSWLLGGGMALAGALCYGELGAMFPVSGGDYVFLKESLGKRVAFLSGWVSLWVGFSAPIAACSIAFGKYMMHLLPLPYFNAGQGTVFLAVAAICLFALTHTRGLLFGARTQNVLAVSEIILIVTLIVFGFLSPRGSWQHLGPAPEIRDIFGGAFATSLIFVSFAYSGWNASAYLGGEIKRPGKDMPKAIFFGSITVIVLYLLLNTLFIYAVPSHAMENVAEIGTLASTNLFGSTIGRFFTLFIAFCLLSTISAMMMTGPRVYFSMAQDGVFFRSFSRVSAKCSAPRNAIYLQMVIAIAMAVTSTFESLLIYMGFVLSIFSSLTVIGLMRLRRTMPARVRPYKVWGYPWMPLLFVSFNGWIVSFCIWTKPQASLWGLLTIGMGCFAYEFFSRSQRDQAFLKKESIP